VGGTMSKIIIGLLILLLLVLFTLLFWIIVFAITLLIFSGKGKKEELSVKKQEMG
jgi:predicted membrane protein